MGYNRIIVENFSNPDHSGTLDKVDRTLTIKDPVCGDQVSIYLATASGRIAQARFEAWGCATSIASANLFCRRVEGLSDADVAAISAQEVGDLLGEIEPSQHHCTHMLADLLAQLQAGGTL